jgi:hypothetical protein
LSEENIGCWRIPDGANEYVPVQQVSDACKVFASLMGGLLWELSENE